MADPFLDLDGFVPYRLSIASNAVSEGIARIYRSLFGLAIPEWRVVAVVAPSDGLTQQEIGARTRMDKVTVSRATIALAHRGLVERRANPGDGRSQIVRLTGSGRLLYQDVVPKALELEKRLMAGFRADEAERLVAMLRRVEDAALTLAAGTTG